MADTSQQPGSARETGGTTPHRPSLNKTVYRLPVLRVDPQA